MPPAAPSTLPETDTTGAHIDTVEQRARRAGRGHGMNALVTATSSVKHFSKFTYNFRFDPKGTFKEGDVVDSGALDVTTVVVRVIPASEFV